MLKTILNNGKQSWCLKQNMGLKIPKLSGNFKYCKLVLDLWIVKRLHYTSTVDQGHFQVIPNDIEQIRHKFLVSLMMRKNKGKFQVYIRISWLLKLNWSLIWPHVYRLITETNVSELKTIRIINIYILEKCTWFVPPFSITVNYNFFYLSIYSVKHSNESYFKILW